MTLTEKIRQAAQFGWRAIITPPAEFAEIADYLHEAIGMGASGIVSAAKEGRTPETKLVGGMLAVEALSSMNGDPRLAAATLLAAMLTVGRATLDVAEAHDAGTSDAAHSSILAKLEAAFKRDS